MKSIINFKRIGAGLIASLVLILCMGTVAFAENGDSVSFKDTAENYFAAGQKVVLCDSGVLDAFAAANDLTVTNSNIDGVAALAANMLTVSNVNVGSDAFIAGNNITITRVSSDGNIMVAGNTIMVNDVVAGSLYLAGNVVSIEADVKAFSISGDTVTFNGLLNGDGKIEADKVIIGDEAVINGTLTIKSINEPEISSKADIENYDYEKITKAQEETTQTIKKVGIVAKMVKKLSTRIFWIPALLLIGAVYFLFFNKNLNDAKDLIKSKTLPYILTGVISWFAVPILAIVLSITCIGLPLAAVLITVYILCLCLGMSFAGASLARLVFDKNTINPYLASVIGITILCIVDIIPFVGVIVSIAADMYMLGYIVLSVYNGRKNK